MNKRITLSVTIILLLAGQSGAQTTVFSSDFEFDGDLDFPLFQIDELNDQDNLIGEWSGDDFPEGDGSSWFTPDSAGILANPHGGSLLFVDRPIADATHFANLTDAVLNTGAEVSLAVGTRRTGGNGAKDYDIFGLDGDGNESFRIRVDTQTERLGYVLGDEPFFDLPTIDGDDASGDIANTGGPAFSANDDIVEISVRLGAAGYSVRLNNLNGSTSYTTDTLPYNGTATELAQVGLFYQGVEGVTGQQSGFFIDDLQVTGFEEITPGDFNSDGTADFGDFLILAANFGTGSSFAEGDFNFDGRVDLVDFGALKDAFNANSPNVAAVPEPNAFCLVALGLLAVLPWRRCRACRTKFGMLATAGVFGLCLFLTTGSGAFAQRVLFHGADLEPTFGSDGDVFDSLEDKLGEGNVVYMQGDLAAADGSDAEGFDALIISATLNSGTVRGKYADLELPVLNWEQALMRAQPGEFNMSSGGGTPGGLTEIDIIDNTHFITEGFDLGVLEVSDAETFSVGRGDVGAGVQILANLPDVPNDHAIMVAEKGAQLLGNGSPGSPAVAPERRATIFLQDNTFGVLNDDGLQLFDRTIDWLLRVDLGCPCNPGDFNADGTVDLADFLVLAGNFGTGTRFDEGDNNFDGRVDLRDFFEFREIFNAPAGAQAAAVPEPSALTMIATLMLLVSAARRRRR